MQASSQHRAVESGSKEMERQSMFVLLNHSLSYIGSVYPARALRALGLLLADGAPTVGGGKTF